MSHKNYKKHKPKHTPNCLEEIGTGATVCLVGKIKKATYKSDYGFVIYSFEPERRIISQDEQTPSEEILLNSGTIQLVAHQIDLNEGQQYKITGEVARYRGLKQVSLKTAEFIEPTTEEAIVAFLSSGLIKGVGEKTARKIVYGYTKKNGEKIDGLGSNTLDVIKEDHLQLVKYTGITPIKAEKIKEAYIKNLEYQEVMLFFQKYKIPPSKIIRIYNEFKQLAIPKTKENPFILEKIRGFGFQICDGIALEMGFNPHNPSRIRSCLLYTLQQSTLEGHCYLTETELLKRTYRTLRIRIPIDRAKTLAIANKNNPNIEIKVGNLTYNIKNDELIKKIKETESRKGYPKESFIVLDEVSIKDIYDTFKKMIKRRAVFVK